MLHPSADVIACTSITTLTWQKAECMRARMMSNSTFVDKPLRANATQGKHNVSVVGSAVLNIM